MNFLAQIDKRRCLDLSTGVLGIYITYLLAGIFHEWMIKLKYVNSFSAAQQNFTWPVGFLIFPTGITWLVGSIYNRMTIQKGQATQVPVLKSMLCALTVGISTITYTYAIYWINFPVVMMVKSCNILSVVLVGVFCSQVKDKALKLGNKKIVVGVIVTLGIVVFKLFDPEAAKKQQKKTEIYGIILLIISLLADGFLPDFQAAIKSVYKPRPMQMMAEINKWVCLLSLMVGLLTLQIFPIILFIYEHSLFLVHMLLMGGLSTLGQMFVYRMIKQFKQHFVPFVITTRKIVTVGLSIIYFHHESNMGQMMGILIVFAIVTYEFVSQLSEVNKEEEIVKISTANPSISDQIGDQSQKLYNK